ncbi:MAG TPA: hypothetical protein VLH79_06285, partial [Chthonomonadales bacterium]|nr:hypothetical protein [Chthonomonadales bacterium]
VWHELNAEEVAARVPTIAGRIAVRTSEGLETVARRIADVLGNPGKPDDEEPVRGTLVCVGPPYPFPRRNSIAFDVRDGERHLTCVVPCEDIEDFWCVVGREAQLAIVAARKETIMGLAQRAYDAGEAIDGHILVVRLEGSD